MPYVKYLILGNDMIETLAQEVIKDGRLMVIKHSSSMAFTPAFPFYLKQVAELIENGHGSSFTSWDDDTTGIIWGEIDDQIVAIFAYHTDQLKYKILNVCLTSVEKSHRGLGIHTIMNRYFELIAKRLGCTVTAATVHPNNTVRLKSAEKDGLKIGYYKLYKRL